MKKPVILKIKLTQLLVIFLLISCDRMAQGNSVVDESITDSEAGLSDKMNPNIIDNTIGVLRISEIFSKGDTVKIFNPDGSLWYAFTFFYDDKEGEFNPSNKEFRPLAFHPDYFLLTLRITKDLGDRYEIIANESTRLTKYMKKSDRFLMFQAWDQHILSLYAIGFDEKKNPLLREPDLNSDRLSFSKEEDYQPHKISGEWLQVKYNSPENPEYGWVRWKERDQLIIECYYLE